MNATNIASYLSSQDGIVAVAVTMSGVPPVFLPGTTTPTDCVTLRTATDLAAVRGEAIRMVFGDFTLNVISEDGVRVAIMMITGHRIAKSLLRMVRRVVRASEKGKLAA